MLQNKIKKTLKSSLLKSSKQKLLKDENLSQSKTVLSSLRDLILTEEVEAGSSLRAAALADKLGVSRTPIRNALAVLESEGVVDYSHNCGYTAREFGMQDTLDAIEVRASIEALAARILAERGLDPEIEEYVKDQLKAGRDVLKENFWSEEVETTWYNLNFNFHRALIRATENRYLLKVISFTLVSPILREGFKAEVLNKNNNVSRKLDGIPAHIWESQIHHERLLKAIIAGESDRAKNLMLEHVMLCRDRIVDIIAND
ncbi:MAG: GntR family transcriptional regulator [Gammaproteobacteria bacterium]|jgi:GntR family transcriptional regulator of vanillate catabolism|nr:MAG: GntR family transcriptional regulator [Gammaproteobacteria bacterium]PHR82265.1 MAG: GntR family transcriptional regulator [Colwellia sp.]